MGTLMTVIMYVLWSLSIIGILVITFANFQYPDLNTIVGVLFAFTLANTYLTLKSKR